LNITFYFAPEGGKVLQSLCLYVFCLFLVSSFPCLKKHTSKLDDIFHTHCLWPLLSPSLMTVQYVVYFGFYGWRQVFTHWGQ